LIGWLLDTNVTAEIISAGGSARVKGWAARQDEAMLYLSILTIAEYDKGIANLPDGDPRRIAYMTTRDSLAARFAARLLTVSDAIVRRWGVISGTVRRNTGHPPPVLDTLLAATALEHDLYLATRNIRDVRHSGAALFNPWEDDPAGFPILGGRRRRRVPDA
jgi:predicted nucleic acid-binding protein